MQRKEALGLEIRSYRLRCALGVVGLVAQHSNTGELTCQRRSVTFSGSKAFLPTQQGTTSPLDHLLLESQANLKIGLRSWR